jgi:hypothetical protein
LKATFTIMLRKFFLVASPAVAMGSMAQNWCPPGARWTHEYANVLGGYFGVQRVEYVGDTMLGGYPAQRLEQTHVVAPWGTTDYATYSSFSLFTHFDGEVVFQWDGVSTYDTLFWFSAEPGDQWHAPGWPDDGNILLTVVDTATVDVDGVPLRRLVVEPFPGLPIDTLYERIGGQFLYLNGWTWFTLDMPWNGLMCYSDQDIDHAAPGVTDCGFTLSVLERMQVGGVSPSPNPGTSHFSIHLPSGMHTIEVFDATGRRLVMRSAREGPLTMDATPWPAGIYTVLVRDAANALQAVRWVKQ